MFDVRLRRFTDAGARGAVLQTLTLEVTQVDSATPRLTFSVSEKIAGHLEAPFLVGVEYTTGGPWVQPRNGLFIVTGESGDEVDPSGAVSFEAEGVVGWLFRYYPLWWRAGDAVLERQYANKTVGEVMLDLVLRAQADSGWAPNLTVGFSTGFSSSGAAWTERVTQNWPLFTSTLATVVQSLAEQGYMEWWADGFHLRVVNPGFGDDHSGDVVLGGPGFTRAPGKAEFDPATQLVVKYDQGWTHFNNPGAVSRFGNVFRVMSQSNTPTRAAAEFNAQPALTAARTLARENSYEWSPGLTGASPWGDFQMGDLVTARTRNGKRKQRVIGIVVTKRDAAVTARVVVGSKLLSLQAKLAKRSAAASVGQIIGGSGAAVPPVQMPGAAPVAPTAVRVASNAGWWAHDGSARADVVIAWDAVTQAVDGTGIEPAAYEVWARLASKPSQLLTTTSDLSVTVDSWTPGALRLVKVRAVSRAGTAGEFSPEISVTPATPASIVPKAPTGLAVSANTASFATDGRAIAQITFTWNAVTQSTDNLPLGVDAYRAEVEDGQEWVPLVEVLDPRQATLTVLSGVARRVRVRARSPLGVWGDPSAIVSATGAFPAAITAAPSKPTLTTGAGGAFIAWDGLLTSGAPPSGFQAVYAEAKIGTAAWARVSGPLSAGAGQVAQVRATVGTVVQARLVLLDTLGRVGATSGVGQVTVAGVAAGDIDQSVTDAIAQAQADASSAGGKVTISADAPVAADAAGKPLGALWWRRSGTGAFIGLWELTALGWVTRAFDETMIPQVNIGTGTYGELDGVRLKATSILVKSLVVSNFNNLADDPSFEAGGAWTLSSTTTRVQTAPRTGAWHLQVVTTGSLIIQAGRLDVIQVEEGQVYEFSFWARTASGTSPVNTVGAAIRFGVTGVESGVSVAGGVTNGRPALTTEYQQVRSRYTVGAGIKFIRPEIRIESGATGTIYVDDVLLVRRVDGDLIVDGGVLARHVTMDQGFADKFWANEGNFGKIRVDMVEPNFGQNLDIAANGSVNIIVTAQQNQQQQIGTAQDTASAAASAAQDAATAAGDAQAGVTNVQGQVTTLGQKQQATQQQLGQVSMYYRFGGDGAIIGRSDSPTQFLLRNTGASIRVNGVDVSTWDAGQMIVPSLVTETVVLSAHRIEKVGARTVFRAITQ